MNIKRSDIAELIGLAALWGASFLFMRMGASQFGPVALAFVRVAGASAFLLSVLALRGDLRLLIKHWRPLLVVGITNSALPFLCFSYAALSITAGLSSIFNATTPLFGAVFAWLWLKDKLSASRVLGLAVGFAGVLWLAADKASFKPGASDTGWAVLACLAATALYGFSASFTKKRLTGVPPLVQATGSQISAALVLFIPASFAWPSRLPDATAWGAAVALALLCTGVAYVLYFRLIANIGPANAIAVTFLIPAFAVLWGALFLSEALTLPMILSCGVILVGTGLTTGLLRLGLRKEGTATIQR